MHAEIKIGNSVLMLSDENPEQQQLSPVTLGGSGSSVMLYTSDVDATFKQATAAGATVVMPLMDMFWGDRMGNLKDPFGHSWAIATHIERYDVQHDVGEGVVAAVERVDQRAQRRGRQGRRPRPDIVGERCSE